MSISKKIKYIAIALACIAIAGAVIWIGAKLLAPPDEKPDRGNPVLLVSNWTRADMASFGETRAILIRPMFGTVSQFDFQSADESVASVDDRGNVTAVGDGETTITVMATVPGEEEPAIDELAVHVERKAQEATAPWEWKGITAGSAIGFQTTATSNMEMTYSSSDEAVATVSPEGEVRAVAPGRAIITATQNGNDDWQPVSVQATVAVVGAVQDRRAALEPFFKAMEEQREWSWNATYGGGNGTLESSKTRGDCTTFPTASLQRVGLLGEPACVWPHSKHAKKHPEYFELYTVDATPIELIESGQMLVGDIVRWNSPMHSQVYVGQDEKGHPLWNSAGRVTSSTSNRAVLFSRIGCYEKAHAISILRIRTYNVSVSWEGPGIMDGGGEVMAKQNCTISFHPEQGAHLESLIVDGTPVDASSGIESYTFEQVLEPHSIEAKFKSDI